MFRGNKVVEKIEDSCQGATPSSQEQTPAEAKVMIAAACPGAPEASGDEPSSPKHHRHISTQARFLGAATTGIVLEPVFQPIDTIVKRLQNNKTRIHTKGQSFQTSYQRLNKVIFGSAFEQTAIARFVSLYQALSVAMFYSAVQRTYKFGGQPVVSKMLDHHFGDHLRSQYDAKTAKTFLEAGAGVLIGMGEPMLLPIDTIKVKMQVGSMQANTTGNFRKLRSIYAVVNAERFSLYNGWEATLARNVPGSLTLFGVSAYMQHHVFHLDNCRHATFAQSMISSAVGAFATVIVTNPADVLKVRAQAVNGQGHVSVFGLFKNVIRQEGVRALYKGVGLRGAVAVPKLTVVKSLSDYLSHRIDEACAHRDTSSRALSSKR